MSPSRIQYAELHCLSNFSFQRGASSARELFARQGPITDAELLDFGFSHADLF